MTIDADYRVPRAEEAHPTEAVPLAIVTCQHRWSYCIRQSSMTVLHRARWVLPIVSPPVRDGWVAVDGGLIVAVGGPDDWPPAGAEEPVGHAVDSAAVLPAVVNAHVHLELSWLHGQVPPAAAMPAWAARLMALRRTVGREPPAPIAAAINEVRNAGTSLVGDISNTLASYEPLAASPLSAVIFRELLGFAAEDPEGLVRDARAELAALRPVASLHTSIVPHAPYSVSPGLFRAIAAASGGERPISIHLAESREEVEFLRHGTGAWRTLLEELGVYDSAWRVPACDPVEYLARLGLLGARLIAVHGVELTDTALHRLASVGATVVACPRSNRWTGAGDPPIERFYASGVRVAVGTDSLASVADLNVFQELAALRRLAPSVSAARLLRSATLDGADALTFGAELGSIVPGKRAELIAVRVPSGTKDVEEYLVQGILPEDIRWLRRD